jgi:TonB family protein
MHSGLGESRIRTSPRAAEPQLRLLVELPSRREAFLENLRDTLLRREGPRVLATSAPGKFWPDVFVPGGIAWRRMAQSGVLHVLAVLAVVAITHLYLRIDQQEIKLRPRGAFRDIEISEYLPPINTGRTTPRKPRHGHPLLAKQKIISLPPRPDNFEQTILSPVDVKLPANVPLPNIVAWTTVPAPPTANDLRPKITLPQVALNVIAPPSEARNLPSRTLADSRDVIGPPPDAQTPAPDRKVDVAAKVIGPPPVDDAKLRTPRQIIAITPAVIVPPPEANLSRNLAEMNVAKLAPTVEAPKPEIAEQRAIPLPPGRAGQASGRQPAAGGAPPIPPQSMIANGPAAGQLIALNLHPANPALPINVPPGRRTGEFAAGPEGKLNAPGTPDIRAGKHTTGPTDGGNVHGNLPSGIVVGNAPGAVVPESAPESAVVAGTPHKTPADMKSILMAAAGPPRMGQVPPYVSSESSVPNAPRVADKIFSGKKSYSMALNMPNLTSAGGSWIIRFAQLDDDSTTGEITAPVAMTKVDPAYPSDLIRDGVEGTVVLYAVIHKDGSVGDVRVLQSLQGRLDENARLALLRWKFRPGTKNGQAVDLVAVVQIPYKASRMAF